MKKVYLSKSNQSDPELVALVRKHLTSEFNVELVEFTGGTYNKNPLLNADVLIVLPSKEAKGKDFYVGKGQFEQITDFLDTCKPIFVVDEFFLENEDEYADLLLSEITDIDLNDAANWQTKYGLVYTNGVYTSANNFASFIRKVSVTKTPVVKAGNHTIFPPDQTIVVSRKIIPMSAVSLTNS